MTTKNAERHNENEDRGLHWEPAISGLSMEGRDKIATDDAQKSTGKKKSDSKVSSGVRLAREDLLTAAEAADYADCSIRTLRKWKAEGEIAYHQKGNWLRFSILDVDEAIAKSRIPAGFTGLRKRRMLRIDQTGRKE